MASYILDTSVLSPLLDPEHERHAHVRQGVQLLEQNAAKFLLSAISLAELQFGVNLATTYARARLPTLQLNLDDVRRRYGLLNITRHTADAYADLKANLARTYLRNPQDRRRWIEDWVDKTSGQKLQIDENDLWMCAQSKERDLPLCTADKRMSRISDADPDVRLHVL